MASARFRLWYILYRRAKKNHSNKSARWSPFDWQFDCGTVMQRNDNTSGFHRFPWGREYTSFSFRSKVSSSVSSTQSSPMYDALPWEIEVYNLIFHRLQSSPNKWSKVHEASWKVRLFPPLLEADTKPNLSPTDIMLQGFSSEYPLASRASFITFAMNKSCIKVLNYLWVTTLSSRVLKSYFDWSKRSDPFLGH